MSYWLYRLAIALVPLLPERLGYWLFGGFGDLVFLFGGKAREAYLNNIKHVLGDDAEKNRMNAIAVQAFRNLLKNYYDLFRGRSMTEPQVLAQVAELTGMDVMEAELAKGTGLVGGGAHFGNFNLFIRLAASQLKTHRKVILPIERLKPERLFNLVARQRAAEGIELVPVDTALRNVVKALRAGQIVGMAVDFDSSRTGPKVDFFGAPARLPDGAVALALKYKVPLFLGFARRLKNNKCVVVVEPPLELESTGDMARDTRAGVEQVARRLEYWISRYPEQWMMFQPFWDEDRKN